MKLGSNNISSIYLGTNAVQSVYLGTNLVWSGVDPDAQAFFDRVTTAGGTLSLTERNAVNTLVIQMKTDGIWTPMKYIYPMVGASASACRQNLKSSSFTGTFSTGWSFASTGVTPNGTSAFFNTNCTPSSQISRNSGSFGIYFNTDRIASNSRLHGAFSSSNLSLVGLYPRFSADRFFAYINTQNGALSTTAATNTLGFRAVSRTSLTNNIVQFNANQNISAQSSLGDCPLNLYLGAANQDGSASDFDSIRIAFAYFSDGLTTTELSNLQIAVQAFQTTLSRNV
jgi:hypothetical protein